MEMPDSGLVLEGFLCPMCMLDLERPNLLTKHFEDVHNQDPEILKSLRDLFGRAKQKILKQEERITEDERHGEIECAAQRPMLAMEPWDGGSTENHTAYFKEIRNARLERYSAETNKLLIRLDKLLNNLPGDPVERRAHERAIVPWIDDRDVGLCPSCAKRFGIGRRKHHCRLCGAVMCHDCTIFLSLADARKMTSPVSQDDLAISPTGAHCPTIVDVARAGIGFAKLGRSTSGGSLNNILTLINDSAGTEKNFRLCLHCMNLLDAREKSKVRQFAKPAIIKYYEDMRRSMEEAVRYSSMYKKMWESLGDGEATYDLRDAQVLRMRIAKIGESVDTTSKRILALGTRDSENPEEVSLTRNLRLYRMIRTAAMIFLKEQILSIPSLPTEEEYAEYVARREMKIQERIASDRQRDIAEEEMRQGGRKIRRANGRTSGDDTSWTRKSSNEPIMEKAEGWGPSSVASTLVSSVTMDPLVEQMSNLRSYIKQARAEFKYDEVATLENNLRELQSAYFLMKENSSDGGGTSGCDGEDAIVGSSADESDRSDERT